MKETKKSCKWLELGGLVKKVGGMALIASCLLSFTVDAQTVRIKGDNLSLKEVFAEVKRQTGYSVFIREDLMESFLPVSLNGSEMLLNTLLDRVLEKQSLRYRIKGKEIILSKIEQSSDKGGASEVAKQQQTKQFVAKVFGEDGKPLSGASIMSKMSGKKTSSKADGSFEILTEIGDELHVAFIGYATYVYQVRDFKMTNIVLERSSLEIDNVVVTGIFDRRAETFTGSATKITRQELQRAGVINIFQSLKNIDPALNIQENLSFGSDPNRMPDMQIRGASSFPDLRGEYATNPNQPLFIVDGFEMTIEKVSDLDINRIASVTILKDASAKALYGSRAANGVIVIETEKVKPGELRINYTGSLSIEAPDLRSYNLTNAAEKLDLEKRLGAYDVSQPIFGLPKDSLYYTNLKEVQSGVNTNWLAQPVRTGLTNKQTLGFEVGDERLRVGATFFMTNTQGVMIGSDRKNMGGSFDISYRYNNILFRNQLQYTNINATNSPYGNFSEYARMNPYWRTTNEDGSIRKYLGVGPVFSESVFNPMYNATINTKSISEYTDITNNTYLEWTASNNLKVVGRVGFSNTVNGSEVFLPASHTSFNTDAYRGDNLFLKGTYDKGNGKASMVSGDLNVNYSKILGKHILFANIGANVREDNSENYLYSAIGFPNDKLDNIIFAKQYALSNRPSGSESINREIGTLGAVNYSFDDRYFADLSIRYSASSQFGSNNRWGAFWSAGAGWNVHNEKFLKDNDIINNLKFRGSLGYTGSQNFNSYQALLLYNYFTGNAYQGMLGTYLNNLANSDLKWQQRLDYNVGMDAELMKRLSFRVDVYKSITTNLLTDITTPPSLGFETYKANLGEMVNTGIEFRLNYRMLVNSANRQSLNLFVAGASNHNKIVKISNSLQSLTSEQDVLSRTTNRPLVRFEEGQSLDAIWAVPSKGIDPATGKEIFVKKDGTLTDIWNTNDKVVVGVNQAKVMGNLGTNFEYKGFSVGVIARYRMGGQIYNQTLVDKVENAPLNYNVDKRAYYDSWKQPGDIVLFKSIGETSSSGRTLASSRFVQDLSELDISSVNLGYDFYRHAIVKQLKLQRLRAMVNLNEVVKFSTVRIERGTSYPFARSFAFTLMANF
ncbi:SusC/RagA family TonB-linked outer membrane protein [Sphingobacterium lumbrici]|uniref:SusC/RagA family TonB-linked outer membrane protein n=1 Tax=Sphingobacterium lumbrici TaxID=2559600 RepID=UPI001125D4A8|nr:SusC/RagA family TonB-linked outer membrane protein [Sphingobacterium lumbrici]